jgi:hypothetical protein
MPMSGLTFQSGFSTRVPGTTPEILTRRAVMRYRMAARPFIRTPGLAVI